ncbi:MAG: DUF3945 domain-containing protein [Prevotellaceae bacterium]|jgi:hypothetical protein|nr:DUF3945 domain-containing protein [Prevotellaceae bacterium]
MVAQTQKNEQKEKKASKKQIENTNIAGIGIDARKSLLENFYQNFMRQYKSKPWITAEDLSKLLPDLERYNISVEQLYEEKLLDQLVCGRILNKMIPIVVQVNGQDVETEGKIRLCKNAQGETEVRVFAKQHEPNLKEYFGHQFTEKQVENIRKTGTPGEVIEVQYPNTEGKVPVLLKLDKDTNIFHAQQVSNICIQNSFFNATLTDDQKKQLIAGKVVKVKNMISKKTGKPFYGNVQYDPQNKALELIFTEQQKQEQFPLKSIGGKALTEQQQQDFATGKTIFVTNLMSKDGKAYHTYVTKDLATQKWSYVNIAANAKQSPRYQPYKELTEEHLQKNPFSTQQQSDLDAGRIVMINGLVDKAGQPFTAHVIKTGEALDYAFQQQNQAVPTTKHKTQVAANNDGHKPKALENVKGPVEQKQPNTPTVKQNEKSHHKKSRH